MENNQDVLLKVEHLKKYYSIKSSSLRGKKSVVKAVDDISFDVKIGETLGLLVNQDVVNQQWVKV